MSRWCGTCYRNGDKYVSCDRTCSVFGKDFDELAEVAIKYENLKSKLEYLKYLAQSVSDNEDSVFADERGVAEHNTREIIDTLLNLELEERRMQMNATNFLAYELESEDARMEITEHLAMNGYTFDSNCEKIIFIWDEEACYLETILEEHNIKYDVL